MNMDTLDDFIDLPSAHKFENYVTLVCPFHESYPVRNSLFIYKDYWICRSCNKQGKDHNYLLHALNAESTIYFEQKRFHNPWNDWLKTYGSIYEVCKEAYKSLKSFPHQMLYLINRGVSKLEIENLKLGYLSGYYIIPMFGFGGGLSGAVARKGDGFLDKSNKYITPNKTYQDNHRLLYVPGGWKRLEQAERVFLTFGILSAVSVYLLGVAAMSTVSGTTIDPTALESIRKPIYILPDFREEDRAHKLADKLSWRGRVIIPEYTDALHDPNDLYVYDKERLERCLDVSA